MIFPREKSSTFHASSGEREPQWIGQHWRGWAQAGAGSAHTLRVLGPLLGVTACESVIIPQPH